METLTFLFTDIEGSTLLLRRVGEDAYGQILAGHHALIRSALASYEGRELNTLGDGFFAAFTSPRGCAAAVLAMQREIETRDWPGGERVRVRMGVHTGEAAQSADTGVLGLDVHRAARIAAVAHGGQILLSETAAALMRDSLPAGAALTDLGLHRLKDLGRPEHLFQLNGPGVQGAFPALNSLGSPRLQNNLPVQPARFVGRQRELAEVRALVESSRLVTLTGAGGSGKTRLSLQAAAELLDGSGDGVWLTELATVRDEDAVPAAIASALGVAPQPARPAIESLVDALAPQNVLIVLDNCEHLISACAKAADLILRRCPRVHLLATSREPLGIGGEAIYRVPSLSLPGPDDADATAADSDAVALFLDRAREQGVSLPLDADTAPLIASICARLDGMPLAIELAAARLRSLSLTELRDRLDQRFRLLTGGSRAALERQQTLHATVDWSYSLLGPAEREVLKRLSVFAESFDLRAAEAVCGFGDIDTLLVAELLGSLVDKSLVLAEQTAGSVRYRLLETIRQFAADRLLSDGTEQAAQAGAAHTAYYLAAAEAEAVAAQDRTGQAGSFSRLAADDANLWRAARRASAEPGGTATVLRFAVALRTYWLATVQGEKATELLQSVLERADARADQTLYCRALVTMITACRPLNMTAARQLGREARDLARQLGDEGLIIETLSTMAGTCYFAGELAQGLPLSAEAVDRARAFGDDRLLGAALMHHLLCVGTVEPEKSPELFLEAVACAERSGDRLVEFILNNNAGVYALRNGDLAAARMLFSRAEGDRDEVGDLSHHVIVNLAWVDRAEGDLTSAQHRFADALRLSRRQGERSGVAYSVLGLACNEADQGDPRLAAELFGAAQSFLNGVGEAWQEPEAGYRSAGLATVRASLGAAAADQAYARGQALTRDEAFALALRR